MFSTDTMFVFGHQWGDLGGERSFLLICHRGSKIVLNVAEAWQVRLLV